MRRLNPRPAKTIQGVYIHSIRTTASIQVGHLANSSAYPTHTISSTIPNRSLLSIALSMHCFLLSYSKLLQKLPISLQRMKVCRSFRMQTKSSQDISCNCGSIISQGYGAMKPQRTMIGRGFSGTSFISALRQDLQLRKLIPLRAPLLLTSTGAIIDPHVISGATLLRLPSCKRVSMRSRVLLTCLSLFLESAISSGRERLLRSMPHGAVKPPTPAHNTMISQRSCCSLHCLRATSNWKHHMARSGRIYGG